MNTKKSFQDMCRTCMKIFSKTKTKNDGNKQSIHEAPLGCYNGTTIMELLQIVQPQIIVEIEDNLPTFMCSGCIKKLLSSYEFIDMYRNVDKKFRKMLREVEIEDCNYVFNELDETLDFIEEDDHAVETKYEFEIEQVNIDDESNNNDWADYEDEDLHELSEQAESKETLFLNPYSDASEDEWTPNQNWQNVSSKELHLENEINDDTPNPSSPKATRNKNFEKIKKYKEELPFPKTNEDGSVPCQQCESVFNSVQLWNEHVTQHQLEKIPKRKYTKKSNRERKNHSGEKDFECEHCGKGFAKISCYKNHLKTHARKMKLSEESYLCIECGKSFKNASSLNTHMLRHKGEKTFQCPHCPKKFVCSSGLYGHMMVHTKEKPFVCDICGSAFHMAYQLRKHNLYHNGIKNYKCEFCDMKFVTREKQRRHMRTHTGEKPYRCKYCERAFAQSNDCVKHLRQHLGDNVYQCELCPLRFPLARDLRAHFATHKDDDEETRTRNLEARKEEERNLQIKLGSKELE